jgi:outer membrane protein
VASLILECDWPAGWAARLSSNGSLAFMNDEKIPGAVLRRMRCLASMNRSFKFLLPLGLAFAGVGAAQNELTIEPANNRGGWLTRPYSARSVSPVRLTNSPRYDALIRSGNLYLTAGDVVALAIENNVDVEVQRYTPLLAAEVLRRARAGGALRSVGVGVAAGPQSVSLQGVSVNTSGGIGASSGGVGSGGGIVTQLGPSIPSFDPTLVFFTNFAHSTSPQSNTILTGTTALITNSQTFSAIYSKNWDFGLSAQVTYQSSHIHLNSQLFALNPYTQGDLDVQITQNLLQGFGRAVNGRNIRVQNNNVKVSSLQFEQQVSATVASALGLYWDLVSFQENVKAREEAVASARQLIEDNKNQVNAGAMAPIEITRAESQLYASMQDLVVARTNLLQQETILKNFLSRDGIAAAGLTSVHVVPLDRLTVPATDELPSEEDLSRDALKNRPELAQARLNLESNQMNLVGIKNSLKPTLQAFAEVTNNGLSGELTALGARSTGISYLAGGYGNLLGEIARRNYPNYSAGISLNIPVRNRAAQADYVTSLMELRQNELNLHKSTNQVRLDVQNAMIGLEQARVRLDAAARSRELAQETLKADQTRYNLGATTPFQVIQDQRDLANAANTETQAMANYAHARISFDQAMGATLTSNHISVDEALKGKLSRESVLPGNVGQGVRK